MKITKKLLKKLILEAMEEEERGSGVVAKLEARLGEIANRNKIKPEDREDFMDEALKTARMMKPEAQKDLEALLNADAMEHFTEEWNTQPQGLVYMVAYAHDPVGEDYFEDILSAEYDDPLKAFVEKTGNPVAEKILNLVLKHILDRHEQKRREDDEYEEMLAQGLI